MIIIDKNRVRFTGNSEQIVLNKYKECLKRLFKACDYMDNSKIPCKDKEKYMSEFYKVIDNCRVLHNFLRKGGRHVPF